MANHVDQLIPVVKTRYDWYGEKYAARFLLEDGTFVPADSDVMLALMIRITNPLLDPRLQIFVDNLDYPMLLEFRARNTGRLRLTASEYGTTQEMRLDFNGFNRIGLAATRPNATIEAIRQQMLSTLSTAQLHLRLCFIDQQEAQDFVSGLQRHFDAPSAATNFAEAMPRARCVEYPWYPYRSTASMTPLTQYGSFVTRTQLKVKIEGQQIMKIPASNHFYDVNEASIKLVYGAYLEYLISNMHLQRLSSMEHLIHIFSVPDSNVLLGAVRLQKLRGSYTPSSMADAPAIVTDGTSCVVKAFNPDTSKWAHYDAVTVPSVFRLPVTYNVLFLLTPSGKPQDYMVNPLSLRNEPSKKWTCKLSFDMHEKSIKDQVNAINTLCTHFERWHPILLNRDYRSLGNVNVFDGLEEETVQRAYDEILALKNWNASQVKVFRLLQRVPGNGFAFIEGMPGCGKTLVEAILAKLLSGLGKHVLIVAPTNAALQAISESIIDNVGDVEAVRVVFAESEKVKEFGQRNDSNNLAESKEVALFRVLQSMNVLRASRYQVASQHDLQTHVDRLVAKMSAENEILPFAYLPDHVREYCLNADIDKDISGEQLFDAIAVYNRLQSIDFTKAPKKSDNAFKEWAAKKGLFFEALETIRATVIARTKVILCTPQLAASDLIKTNFAASGTEGIVILADEDGQCLEPMAWIPVVIPRQSNQVRAVLRFGDRKQLPPLAHSATSNLSEFGPQMNRSLIERHLQYHAPAASLNVQYRMHPMLSRFPNNFTYDGKIVDGAGTAEIKLDDIYQKRLIEWARPYMAKTYEPDADFARLLAVNVKKAEVLRDPSTQSRSNARYVEVLSTLLNVLFKEKPYPKATIRIIVAYSAQKAFYLDVLKKLQQRTGLPFASLPTVNTIDSMQGHEADIIFVDWTNVYRGPLGFLTDNRRTNVALTRAHASLVVFFSQGDSGEDFDEERPAKRKTVVEVRKHWDWLVQNGKEIHVRDTTVVQNDDGVEGAAFFSTSARMEFT